MLDKVVSILISVLLLLVIVSGTLYGFNTKKEEFKNRK